MKKVTMTATRKVSPDGATVMLCASGETYELPDDVAAALIKAKDARVVGATAPRRPSRKKTAPASGSQKKVTAESAADDKGGAA